jgi:glutaredoxin
MSDKITIITRDDCGYCTMAKDVLEARNIDYEEKSIPTDIERNDVLRMVEEAGIQNTLPVFLLNDEVKGNYVDILDYAHPPLEVGE